MADHPRAPKWSWRRRTLVVGVAAVVIGGFAVAGLMADTDGNGAATHPSVEALIPEADSQTVRQVTIGVDLEIGWTAELEVNRTYIPPDQLENFDPALGRVDDPLGRVLYDPGPDKEFEVWPQGQVCVTAYLTRIDDPDERAVESWCFTAT